MADPEKEMREYLLDQLQLIGPVEARRMFGAHGFFLDGLMFAIYAQRDLYFKADEQSRGLFEARGLAPFSYQRGGRDFALRYYSAPEEAMDDAEQLAHWANIAFAAALRQRRD